MGVSKVDYYGETLIDLTEDTVNEETVVEGVTFTNSAGEKRTGSFVPFSGDYNDLTNKPISYASITDIDYRYNGKVYVANDSTENITLIKNLGQSADYVVVLYDENGVIHERKHRTCLKDGETGKLYFYTSQFDEYFRSIKQIDGTEWEIIFKSTVNKEMTLQIYHGSTYSVVQLDEEFIPDTIARKTDVENLATDAVNAGLQAAKESGEFKGEKGDAGYTPQKGVDYFDGQNGENGQDGVSATHSWNGTTLTITSASGTSSANLKGEKGDTGSNGSNGKDGVSVTHSWSGTTLRITSASGTSSANLKGEKGDNGYTPVKGTDYFTNADKQELVTSVINSLPTWTGGSY